MVFNSLTFIVFFAVLLLLHRPPLSWTTEKVNLLLASYVFYAAWNPPFIRSQVAVEHHERHLKVQGLAERLRSKGVVRASRVPVLLVPPLEIEVH